MRKQPFATTGNLVLYPLVRLRKSIVHPVLRHSSQFDLVVQPRRVASEVRCQIPRDREAFPHFPSYAPLLGEDDLGNGGTADDEPEEEGGREGGGVVGREDEVVENESDGEIEDVGWSSDDVVQVKNATKE